MANEIRTKFAAKANFTVTLASLANNAARQSTMVNNTTNQPAAMVYVRIKSGATAPTANTVYEIYLLRGDDAVTSTYRTDNAGATDAAITIENAPVLGTVIVTATAAKNFYAEFDTALFGPLGPQWGIAIKNTTGQALSATGGDHLAEYCYYVPELQ